jgi:phenylacetate-CoA ligase
MTMDLDYDRKRIVDVARGFRRARVLTARERWPRERLAALQRERIDALVRDAIARSPFYRERLGPHVGRAPVELAALPVLDKATMMERFDELVTDPRLRREALLEHLEDADGDELLDGEFRVMATSGSSGRKGLYVYDRSAWIDTVVAPFLRINAIIGVRPQLPRLRVAAIGGGAPTHMTRRGAATFSLGLHRLLSLPVTMPVDEMAAALEAHRPEYMTGFASRIALLADEQLAACESRRASCRPRASCARPRCARGSRPPSASRRSTSMRRPRGSGARRARTAPGSTSSRTSSPSRTSTRTAGPCPTASAARSSS